MSAWMSSNRRQKCFRCGSQIEENDKIFRKAASVYFCAGCGVIAEGEPVTVGELEQAVLDDLAKMPDEAADSVLAKSLLKLARKLDADEVPPREMPAFTKELRLLSASLRDEYPVAEDDDPTDRARASRERRMREMDGI